MISRSVSWKTLVLLLLAVAVSYATTLDELQLAFPAVLGIMVIVLAITYMLSKTMESAPLEAWARSEIRELIVGVILFVIVMGLFFSGANLDNTVIQIITGTSDLQYKAVASSFLASMEDTAASAFKDNMKAFHWIGLRSGYTTSGAIPGFYFFLTIVNTPHAGAAALFSLLSQASIALSNVLFLYSALAVLLDFFLQVGPKLIYLAFAFRFVPFTRPLGSTLVAVIIGVYVLFPFSLVLVSKFHSILENDAPQMNLHPHINEAGFEKMEFFIAPGLNLWCRDTADSIIIRTYFQLFGEIGFAAPLALACGPAYMACFKVLADVVYPLMINVLMWGYTILLTGGQYLVSPDAAVLEIFDVLRHFLNDVNGLAVLSYIDAVMVLVITVVGIRSISVMLGGEYMIPGLQRFV